MLVYSKSEDEHVSYLRIVLQVHKEYYLFSKYNKFKFWLILVAFLCHIVSSVGIEVDSKKMEEVKNRPRPLTPTDIQSFFSLVRHYKIFLDIFPSISSPLTTLMQNKVKFEWTEACEKGFQKLKDKLTSALVLTLWEGAKGFVVYCDASRVGLGCLLMQHGKVIAYALRQL